MVTTAYSATFINRYSNFSMRKLSILQNHYGSIQDILIGGLKNEFNLLSDAVTAGSFAAITYSQDPRISAINIDTTNGYIQAQAGSSVSGLTVTPTQLSPTVGGANPYTLVVKSAPLWATVNLSTGAITGTPVITGSEFNFNTGGTNPIVSNQTQYFVIDALDAFGNSACGQQVFALTVVSTLSPSVTSSATASGVHATPFSYTVTASNSPTSFGLLDDTTGVLAIVPSTGVVSCATLPAAGSYTFAVNATNKYGVSMNLVVTLTVS